MKKMKVLSLIIGLSLVLTMAACGNGGGDADTDTPSGDGPIKVGIINNPPSESGYRAANVKDFETVFTEANGYDASTYYSINNDEQLDAAKQFITDGVDYLLLSAASTDGWDGVLNDAKEAGVKVILFDRMVNADEGLYEAAVVSDMAQEGETAVTWLKGQSLATYDVVHIQGVMGSDAQKGRTGALDAEFASGAMTKIVQQTGNWSADEAKAIVESVINSGKTFNVVYAENDDMAKGAVAALDAAGITHGVGKDVVIMGFDCNKWALKELLAGNWNYDGQCSPFQATVIDGMIKQLQAGETLPEKKVISEEKGFDATTITQEDIDTYGLGD
ncbi:MAG: substrate-binding domain-containing protein [Clostridiales Family XIII bacterium]|jgi:simple sugar transport system substrate-binding protein|nr:substrate-binding domain-containing protein [Clostridiales Family XIII bacterium]